MQHTSRPTSEVFPGVAGSLWTHSARRITTVAGGLCVLLGMLVLAGWSTHNVPLVRLFPAGPPMPYNTALNFFLGGIGLLALTQGRSRLVASSGCLVMLIGLLTLSDYLFDINLELAQFLVPHLIPPGPPRIAPNAALAFLLTGTIFLVMSQPARREQTLLIARLCGLVVMALGVVASGKALPAFREVYGWGGLTEVATHTAIGCLLLGLGIMASTWRHSLSTELWRTRWYPLLVGVGVLAITIGIWQALLAEEKKRIAWWTQLQIAGVQHAITARMEARIMPLVRMARFWEMHGKPDREVWATDAELYANDYQSLQAVAWVDPSLHVRWVAPLAGNEGVQDLDLGFEEHRRQTLELAGGNRTATLTRALDFSPDVGGFQVSVPIFVGDAFDGFILGAFRLKRFLDVTLENLVPDYGIAVFDGKEELYRRAIPNKYQEKAWAQEAHIDLYGVTWQMRLWPTSTLLAKKRSPLPTVVLASGLLTAVLLMVTARLAQTSRLRATQVERANHELQHEITMRQRTEAELVRISHQNKLILDSAGEGICGLDNDGKTTFANPAAARMLGCAVDELLGQTVQALAPPAEAMDPVPPGVDQAMASSVPHDGTVFRRQDGSLFPVEYVRTPIVENGTVVGMVVTFRDITERKETEAQLQRQQEALYQSEKLATMGSLLASIAHELNNPLSVVMMQADLLKEEASTGQMATYAEKVHSAAERCVRIVKNFLALARQRSPERSQVCLNDVVDTALELLDYSLRVDNVEVCLQRADNLPMLWADAHQLQQVVVNLTTNAYQAMHDHPGPRRLRVTTWTDAEQSQVYLEVADTGPGIPPEIRTRIFEPFFTTKAPGAGTGLGLSLCQGMIESHKGTLTVDSQPGQGAIFRVQLPVEAAVTLAPQPAPLAALPCLQTASILVVDDEPGITSALAYILGRDGHRVDTAANGQSALEKLREQSYDVLLSDLRMPEVDGMSLYREVERHYPHLLRRVIFLTGDTLSVDSIAALEQVGAFVLSKPFNIAEVQGVIQRALQEA